MAKLSKKEIHQEAIALMTAAPDGIRYGELVASIAKLSPETPVNTIHGSVWNLHITRPDVVSKPERGLFVYVGAQPEAVAKPAKASVPKYLEADFYEPFADYLKNELDEVTEVVTLGGSIMASKWGTPDVIGVYKARAAQRIKFSPEIVTAEIKSDTSQAIVAFGQAVAYRLFSWKTYIVMPQSMSEEDKARLESLCMLFGVGLVFFALNPLVPNFEIRVRAQRFLPDMYYVNVFADSLHKSSSEKFEQLFG